MPTYDLFVSYRRLDAQRVRPLVGCLRGLGLNVWLDEGEIEDFAAVTHTIAEGLGQSKAVLTWYSAIYPLSRSCQWELTAAYLAAQQGGDPRQRVLVVNPEASPDHVALPELKDQQYLSAPAIDDQAGYDKLATRIAVQAQALTGILGDIRPLISPSWFPYMPTGSARFVGRLRHMWQIHGALWRGQTVIGQLKQGAALAQLVGGGGMGNSLLAEEYALRYGAANPGGVFWLSARQSSESGATASVDALAQQRELQWRNLAAKLGMEIKDKTLVQIEGDLQRYFAGKSQPFLWIVDDLPNDVPMEDVRSWCAPQVLGKTLLTTRSHEYAALGGKVDVGVLADAEARSLLTQQRLPADDAEASAVDGILAALGCHALAVDVAAARLKGKPYPEFLADLHRPDTDALELARHFAGQLPNGHEASIAVTLLQSINNVREETRDLLRLAAVLAVVPIPRRLVAGVFGNAYGLGVSDALNRADLALHEALEQSLAEATGDADFSVTVHVLVSRTGRFCDSCPARTSDLRAVAMQVLTAELATQVDDIRNHAALGSSIEHARHLVAGMGGDLASANLCGWIARYDYVRGAYAAARALQESVLAVRRRVQGEEHPDTLRSLTNLASTLCSQGDLGGGRALEEQGLKVRRRLLGEEDPDTLISMNNLAATLGAQGDLPAARALQEAVLEVFRRELGEEHPTTLTSMNNLASTLWMQGDLAGARTLLEKCLGVRRRLLGEEHPDTLSSMSNLAAALGAQGDFPGAHALEENVLMVIRQVLGEDHPDVLTSMSNLASTLWNLGDLIGARALEEKALGARSRVLGEEHPDTLTGMSNLAYTLWQMDEHLPALQLMQTTAEGRARVLGPDNLHALGSKRALEQMRAALSESETQV